MTMAASPAPTAFRGQRRATLIALAAIILIFGLIASWNLGRAGFSEFYSSAARSMSMNWRAFFFGTFDPGASITLDKLSGFLVPQAVSARIFGFHAWSIALPQVIEGMITVGAAYVVVCRWKGAAAGILAATMTACTPLLPSMFGHVMEDGLLTMSLALALASWQTSALTGRVVPLLGSGIWVGIGFQAKMMQAWLIVPAIVIGILVSDSLTGRARVRRALVFLATSAVASLSWMTIVALIPPGSRPYIDGSTNNNVFSMVFGYNGFNRLIPNLVPGAAPDFVHRIFSHQPSGGATSKLLTPAVVTQVGWLYPLALVGVIVVVVAVIRGRQPGGGAARATGLTVVVWLGLAAALLTAADVPHNAYFAAIAVQIAVLAAVGLTKAIRLLRSDRRTRRIVLPAVIAAETAWAFVVLQLTTISPAWLGPVVVLLGAIVVVTLVVSVSVSVPARSRITRAAAVAGMVASLIAPAVWTGATLDLSLDGSANDAYAGPRLPGTNSFFRSSGSLAERSSFTRFAVRWPQWNSPDPKASDGQRGLVRYLQNQQPRDGHRASRYLLATTSWSSAAPLILRSGVSVLPMGGFSGALPAPTLGSFIRLVGSEQLRFVEISSRFEAPAARHPSQTTLIESWVVAHCSLVSPQAYAPAGATPSAALWRCSSR